MSPLEEKLAELGARFRARAGEELTMLDAALANDDRNDVIDRAHKLAGIAGMFGYREVGSAARELEKTAIAGAELRGAAAPLRAQLMALIAS